MPQRDRNLVAMLRPHQERIAAVPGLKTLKSALRAAAAPSEAPTDSDPDTSEVPDVPDDWPLLPLTTGRTAVIVGGDPRPRSAERIKDAFKFDTVDWEHTDPRRIRALSERLRSGSVNFAILLRGYIGHSDQVTVLDACRGAGVPFVVVDAGYGVSQVRRAIERFRARGE